MQSIRCVNGVEIGNEEGNGCLSELLCMFFIFETRHERLFPDNAVALLLFMLTTTRLVVYILILWYRLQLIQ
jgi:hypothetical protein